MRYNTRKNNIRIHSWAVLFRFLPWRISFQCQCVCWGASLSCRKFQGAHSLPWNTSQVCCPSPCRHWGWTSECTKQPLQLHIVREDGCYWVRCLLRKCVWYQGMTLLLTFSLRKPWQLPSTPSLQTTVLVCKSLNLALVFWYGLLLLQNAAPVLSISSAGAECKRLTDYLRKENAFSLR